MTIDLTHSESSRLAAGLPLAIVRLVKPQPSKGTVSCREINGEWEFWGPLDSEGRGLLYEHSIVLPRPGDVVLLVPPPTSDADIGERLNEPIAWQRPLVSVRVCRVRDVTEQEAEWAGYGYKTEVCVSAKRWIADKVGGDLDQYVSVREVRP